MVVEQYEVETFVRIRFGNSVHCYFLVRMLIGKCHWLYLGLFGFGV
jgi:hypothetical protein